MTTWALGSVRIFTQKQEGIKKQIIARLQPLSGGTIHQTFGYERAVLKLGCKVVGDADMDTLETMTTTATTYALTNYEGTIGSVLVSEVQKNRDMCICQTLRTDLDKDSPVYSVELTLYFP